MTAHFYIWIILGTLVFKFLVDTIAQVLNQRSLQSPLPGEFTNLYDAEKYTKSQTYTRVSSKFHLVESFVGLVLLLAFWFLGGFPWLDATVRSWGHGTILTGVVYIGILAILGAVLSLPFDVYSTFVIEERFGFNRTTPRIFILDRLKGLALSLILGVPLLSAVLWFFEKTGSHAWLFCWLFAVLFSLVVQYVAPVWIMPLFNKYNPLPEGELRDAIGDYAKTVRFSYSDIYVMDGSKRSSHSNAFFTGFGKNKRIVLFDTLVERHSVDEIVAILAHEVGHYKKRHIVYSMLLGFAHTGILFFLLSLFLQSRALFDAFFMKEISVYAGLLFFGLLYEPVSFVLSIFINMYSRRNEFEADRYARETLENPELIVSALKTLHVNNLSNLTPHRFYVFLKYSHPPLLRRVQAVRAGV